MSEKRLQKLHEELAAQLRDTERRNKEISQLSEMVDLLQSASDLEEAFLVIRKFAQSLFQNVSGSICLISASRNIVETASTWGDLNSEQTFTPGECWALRRGHTHIVEKASAELACKHLQREKIALSICVPMMAHGESLGVINFRRNTIETADPDQKLMLAFVEQSALAISNLQLRETLKSQAIRDSLTGLFNRRYFEEAFDRELRRAMRSTFQVAIVMMDVDYFKKFNDSFGHEAGDLILRELGRLLQGYIRGGDVAGRFGGEEFILMFPECDLDNATERACQLSAQIKRITLNYNGQLVGPISTSAGIAGYPSHGYNRESILRSADKVLYEAKMAGRDRVVTTPVGA